MDYFKAHFSFRELDKSMDKVEWVNIATEDTKENRNNTRM